MESVYVWENVVEVPGSRLGSAVNYSGTHQFFGGPGGVLNRIFGEPGAVRPGVEEQRLPLPIDVAQCWSCSESRYPTPGLTGTGLTRFLDLSPSSALTHQYVSTKFQRLISPTAT